MNWRIALLLGASITLAALSMLLIGCHAKPRLWYVVVGCYPVALGGVHLAGDNWWRIDSYYRRRRYIGLSVAVFAIVLGTSVLIYLA